MEIPFKEITKKLLAELPERNRAVLLKRYGLGKTTKRETLEAIGREYKITRERVRQIEAFALGTIKKSKAYVSLQDTFDQLKKKMEEAGGVVHEQIFLDSLAKDKATQNHIHFSLVVSDAFFKLKEDEQFHHRWTTDLNLADQIHLSLNNLCAGIGESDLVSETELVEKFNRELKEILTDPKVAHFAESWLRLSKMLAKNPLGEWGLSVSPNIRMRGIRDFAYLVLRQKGEPMHFSEVARQIEKVFGRKAHSATCHNELIKDKRFVLVGRGLYALSEWGYTKGTVVEVIKRLIREQGPLTRDEVVAQVMKERQVKHNTIVVNLQNARYFQRLPEGKFTLLG
ncbi:MAG: hypothetical protein COV08_02815 [Candidatus Vogelbacteria bacterium CG10_big_fil_rev_8_21_14_0_10_49_38]|uniref:HTH HARE-type domain-containing protein n=1 Tax=Candidatus Vogelbacteria bacterium CG10_big_fil_rev_8_21_14_0_10_49_38 TaxID=1975043 RepID=A0A2H0RHH3_9BACT|nr:MAG: hypothetical protein BK006_02825 [bacterium CG10_49_38]PIR45876.1 MAG: hypothetical protein COV08_02815 [Candidatus Vogelbacteria bacterium CG10_big_fil_rev_8_21_14_0_10_49_38]